MPRSPGATARSAPRSSAALADELPLDKRDGGFVRAGLQRRTRRGAKLARRQPARHRRDAGALRGRSRRATLKIKHNNFLGYLHRDAAGRRRDAAEAPHAQTFIHRQTMQGAMRFTTEALIELEARIASAADRALELELDIFEALQRAALARSRDVARPRRGAGRTRRRRRARRARGQARVDAAAASTTRSSFAIEGGRHPVVEAALAEAGEPFVANDCDLSGAAARAAASPSSPAPTWRANRPICGRTR